MLLAACGLAACHSDKPKVQAQQLQATQFASVQHPAAVGPAPAAQADAAAKAPTAEPEAATPTAAPRAELPASRPIEPSDTLALRSYVGEPDLSTTPAKPTATPIVLESVIGQINGRPLFASEILTPLDGRLRAVAEKAKGNQRAFVNESLNDVVGVITNKVRDELMLAEAQASLPPEARQGLFYFLGKIQQNMVSTQSGSKLQADEALRESTGRTLQQEARDRLERELIITEIRNKIVPRVNIPWRLIRQEYERNYAKYNPPGTAMLRVIMVPADNADSIREAEEAIASKAFAEAAEMPFNTFLRSEGGATPRELEGEYADAPLFASPEMTAAAQKLKPGQTTPSIKWQNTLAWVHLDAIDRAPGISLYDAQLEIEATLRERKFAYEREVYYTRLLERGSFTRIESMVQEAMTIAIERYVTAPMQ